MCAVLGGVALLAGCAGGGPGAVFIPEETVPADLVTLTLLDGTPTPANTVLEDRDEVVAFAGRIVAYDERAAEEFRERAEAHDFSRSVLLAFLSGAGCDVPGGAELRRRGQDGGDFTFRFLDVARYEECYAPKGSLVVFALPEDQLPPGVTLGGYPPRPAGVGELVAFERVGAASQPPAVVAAEVSQPDQAGRFLAQFPDGPDEPDRAFGSRLFAFAVTGCAGVAAAVLVVERDRLSAVAPGGDDPACDPADLYVAVFEIDARSVPPDARIAP